MTIHASLSLCLAGLAAQADPQTPREAPLVTVELLADTARIAPGEPFQLGVRFRMAEHWHIYWENPGDGGIPTGVRIEAPPGFEVDLLPFPGPERFELTGGIVNYGYEDEVVLFADVRSSGELEPGSEARFSAEADWLVCREVCHLGRQRVELTLPIAGANGSSEPTHADLLAPHRARLPRPWRELEGVSVRWGGEPELPHCTIAVSGAEALDFFPALDDDIQLARRPAFRAGDGTRSGELLVVLQSTGDREHAALAARGLLRVQRDGRAAYYAVDQTWPHEDEGE